MQHFSIPACYFPSTALFIDDSRDFLLNFVLQLDESMAYRVFDVPRQALDYIHHKRCELDLLSQHCLREYKEAAQGLSSNHTIHLDLAAIYAEVYNPHRFSEISVVVVDYAMPGMNGLEFCRLIENKNIKKILLTGQADEALAIAAFHEGLIHRYIKKSEGNAADRLTQCIYELQLQYFQAMSDTLVQMLAVTSPSCLHDDKFAHFFREIRQQHGIIEFYLMDYSGSFFMLDDDANVSFLIVKSEDDKRAYCDLAHQQGISKDMLCELNSGDKIPALWRADVAMPIDKDWSSCLVPASRFVSSETYYYAIVPGNLMPDERVQKILSYHRYLEEIDAQELLID
ncbi:MAG: response regulator [Legionellales bacterium]|nr:response regulator [Legionellales bacterium]